MDSFKQKRESMVLPPLDFTCIEGYPHHYAPSYLKNMPMYDGHVRHTYHNICQFLSHISNYGEVLEDILMKCFSHTRDGNSKL